MAPGSDPLTELGELLSQAQTLEAGAPELFADPWEAADWWQRVRETAGRLRALTDRLDNHAPPRPGPGSLAEAVPTLETLSRQLDGLILRGTGTATHRYSGGPDDG